MIVWKHVNDNETLPLLIIILMLFVLPTSFVLGKNFPSTRKFANLQYEGIQVTLGKTAADKIPFIPPTIHLFTSGKEFEREIQSDPYNDVPFQYKDNREIDMKEGIDYMSLNEKVRNFEGGSMNYYHVQAKMLSGAAHLDNDPNVYDVSCKNVNELSEIVVDFADFDSTVRKMIPGTRLIVGKGWNCYNSRTRLVYGDEIAKYFLVIKRERIFSDGKMVRIKFFTKPISFTQLFLSGKVTYSSSPQQQPIVQSSNDHPQGKKSSRNTDFSFNNRFTALKFNYDQENNRAISPTITLFEEGSFKLVCEECYVLLNSEFKIEFEFSWTDLKVTRAVVTLGGKWDFYSTLKSSVSKSFNKKVEGIIAQSSPIRFTFFVWAIPIRVELTPLLKYSTEFEITGSLEYSRKFHMSFEKTMGFNYTTDNGYNNIESKNNEIEFENSSPGIKITTQGNIEFALIPSIDIKFYGLETVQLAITPKLRSELTAEGIISSAKDFKLFVKINCFYSLMLSFNVLNLKQFELSLLKSTLIEELSGSYSVLGPTFDAINDNKDVPVNNTLPIIVDDEAFISNTIFYFEILEKLDDSYDVFFVYYLFTDQLVDSNDPNSRTLQFQSRGVRCGSTHFCTRFDLVPNFGYKYIYFEFKKGTGMDENYQTFYSGTIDQVQYKTINSDQNIFSSSSPYQIRVLASPFPNYQILSFSNTPSQTFQLPQATLILSPINPINYLGYISFYTDAPLSYNGLSIMYSINSNGKYVYSMPISVAYGSFNDLFNGVKILNDVIGNTITFIQYIPMNSITTSYSPPQIVISKPKSIVSFYNFFRKATKMQVYAKVKGNFIAMLFEGWITSNYIDKYGRWYYSNYVVETQGKKIRINDFESGNLASSKTYTWTISLSNQDTDISLKRPIGMVQFIPSDQYGFIIESISILCFREQSFLTESKSITNLYSDEWLSFLHSDRSESVNPYLYISRVNFFEYARVNFLLGKSLEDVMLRGSIQETIQNPIGQLGILQDSTESTIIPINSDLLGSERIFLKYYESLALNIFLFQNNKLLNGIASKEKRVDKAQSYALPCSSILSYIDSSQTIGGIFLRVMNSANNHVSSDIIGIKVELLHQNSTSMSNISFDTQHPIIKFENLNSIIDQCQLNPTSYISIILTNKIFNNSIISSPSVKIEISFTRLIRNTINMPNLIVKETLNTKNSIPFIDLSEIISKEQLLGKQGIILKANTVNCNIEMYINQKDQSLPSFYDYSTIFGRSKRLSTYESLPISFLTQQGSILMLYSETACQYSLSYEEFKTTSVSLNFIHAGKLETEISTLTNDTIIQIQINDDNQSWDQVFVTELLNNGSNILDYLTVKTKSGKEVLISDYSSPVICTLINPQTLHFEMKTKEIAVQEDLVIGFNFKPFHFTTRFDIKAGNTLTIRTDRSIQSISSKILSIEHLVFFLILQISFLIL